MPALARLGIFAAGLVVTFFAAGFAASAVVPESLVRDWQEQGTGHVDDVAPAEGEVPGADDSGAHEPGHPDEADHQEGDDEH